MDKVKAYAPAVYYSIAKATLIVFVAIFPEQDLTNQKKGRALTLALTLGIKTYNAGWAEALAKGGWCDYFQTRRGVLTNNFRAAVGTIWRSDFSPPCEERKYATL